ncbi:putative transcription factor C2H2 family [Helianthus annuus]|nr:putative transcription factor C2H2 family [Helianthus annuus]
MPIPPPPPPMPPPESDSSLARLIRTTLSYDTNVMLAAIISLLLVILFVLLLHLYTRWFLLQARRRSHSSVTVPRVLGSRLHQSFTIIDTTNSDHSSGKLGLPISIISSLPLFVYKLSSFEDRDYALECAICLCVFEEEEIGRKLPVCGHAFHVECIDMWLHSHSTCPICRAAIQCNHSRKIDHLEIEITNLESNSDGLAINNDEDLRLEIVTISNRVEQPREIADVASSSLLGESQSSNKLLNSSTSNSSSSSRSGGKVHPSLVVNGDECEG